MAGLMQAARRRWTIIGSAAVLLHGGDAGEIADIDVLVDAADIPRLDRALGGLFGPGEPTAQFRSAAFARWTAPPLPVEFMAGLEVCRNGHWTPVAIPPPQLIGVADARLPVPDRTALIALLDRFGREKDRRRAAALR